MRFIKHYIVYIFLSTLLITCQREIPCYVCDENNNDNTDSSSNIKSEWQFDESTNHYNGPVDTAYLNQQDAGQILTVTGTSFDSSERIFISIKSVSGSIVKGSYSTQNQQVKFYYYNDADKLYAAVPLYGGNITVQINSIDSLKVQGAFSGSVIDVDKKTRTILNGTFSSPLKKQAANDSKGSLILWAKELCNGPIKIKVNDSIVFINQFAYAAPDCGDPHAANYSLDTGMYKWVAYCGKDSVTGDVHVIANTCIKVLVEFEFQPPDTTRTTDKNCKLDFLSFNGCLFLKCGTNGTNQANANAAQTSFSAQQPNNISYTGIAYGFPVSLSSPVIYSGNMIIINPGAPFKCEFTTDGNGRIIEYHGASHPEEISPLDSVVIKYSYDNAGNLITRTTLNPKTLSATKEIDFTWQNGNVVQMIEKNLTSGNQNFYSYNYYTNRTIEQQPFLFTNCPELLLYQSVLNFGNHIINPVQSSVLKAKDINGNDVSIFYNYENYVVDDNNYLIGFDINRNNVLTSFSFSYTCF